MAQDPSQNTSNPAYPANYAEYASSYSYPSSYPTAYPNAPYPAAYSNAPVEYSQAYPTADYSAAYAAAYSTGAEWGYSSQPTAQSYPGSWPPKPGKSAVDPARYKTTMCRQWQQTGKCSYEKACHFAHGEEELNKGLTPPPRPPRNQPSGSFNPNPYAMYATAYGGYPYPVSSPQPAPSRNGGGDVYWSDRGPITVQRGTAAAKVDMDPARYKTILCKNWMTYGKCSYETVCQFAHGRAELRGEERTDPSAVLDTVNTAVGVPPSSAVSEATSYGSSVVQAEVPATGEVDQRAADIAVVQPVSALYIPSAATASDEEQPPPSGCNDEEAHKFGPEKPLTIRKGQRQGRRDLSPDPEEESDSKKRKL